MNGHSSIFVGVACPYRPRRACFGVTLAKKQSLQKQRNDQARDACGRYYRAKSWHFMARAIICIK